MAKKEVAFFLVIILIINLILYGMGKVSGLVFWALIILIGAIALRGKK